MHKKCKANQWFESAQDEDNVSLKARKQYRGVVLQTEDGNYISHPSNLHEDVIRAFLRLNVPVAFTMSSEVTRTLISQADPNQKLIGDPKSGNPVLPVIDSIESLALGMVEVPQDNFVCLCWKEQFVLVWGDTVRHS